jgi:hypothetical protein
LPSTEALTGKQLAEKDSATSGGAASSKVFLLVFAVIAVSSARS